MIKSRGKALFSQEYRAVWALVLMVLVGAFLAFLPGKHPNPSYALLLYNEQMEKLHSFDIYPGQEVVLSYRHSSDGTPVAQIFEVGADGALHLLEERYSWYGAGLEHGSGHHFTYEGDTVRVSGYDRQFSELLLRVARTVPQEIVVSGESVLLADLAPGGTRLLVKVEKQ